MPYGAQTPAQAHKDDSDLENTEELEHSQSKTVNNTLAISVAARHALTKLKSENKSIDYTEPHSAQLIKQLLNNYKTPKRVNPTPNLINNTVRNNPTSTKSDMAKTKSTETVQQTEKKDTVPWTTHRLKT